MTPSRHRLAEAIRDERRENPQEQDRCGSRQRSWTRHGDDEEGKGGEHRTAEHLLDKRLRAESRCEPCEAGGRGRRLPLEHLPVGEDDTDERDQDGVRHLRRLIRQKDELQAGARQRRLGVLDEVAQHHAPRLPRPRAGDGLDEPERRREHEREHCRERPQRGVAGHRRPAVEQDQNRRRRDEAPPQVVEDLPARDQRKPIARDAGSRRHPGKEPQQDLPVAAHPAMLAARVREDARWIVVHDFDVGDERSPRVEAFEEVVREHGVFGHAVLERRHERVDLVEALAGEDAFVEQILIEIRHRRRVRIDARVTGVEA